MMVTITYKKRRHKRTHTISRQRDTNIHAQYQDKGTHTCTHNIKDTSTQTHIPTQYKEETQTHTIIMYHPLFQSCIWNSLRWIFYGQMSFLLPTITGSQKRGISPWLDRFSEKTEMRVTAYMTVLLAESLARQMKCLLIFRRSQIPLRLT